MARPRDLTPAVPAVHDGAADQRGLRLYGWRDAPILALAVLALAAGFGQFGAVASLGQVAKAFGHTGAGATIADRAGLSGTELGLGLAVVRFASLGGLLLAGLADRFGRRRLLLFGCAGGLVLTVAAAGSPNYWWFVALFACGRPMLSATSALTQVGAAEQTDTHGRARAIALVAAGYAAGSGLTAVLFALAGGSLGFRGIFALGFLPLVLLPFAGRRLGESDRYERFRASAPDETLPVLGAVARPFRRRLAVVGLITFAVAVVTGPATSFLFVYVENVLGVPGSQTALLVVGAGILGIVGLVLGQQLADRVGRRITAAGGLVALVGFGVLAYSGSRAGVVSGYLLGILAAATFAPAAGALGNELFPTRIRASVAGWIVAAGVLGAVAGLLAFGAVADVHNRFSAAAVVTFLPALAALPLFLLLPETKGREPEDLWPAAD